MKRFDWLRSSRRQFRNSAHRQSRRHRSNRNTGARLVELLESRTLLSGINAGGPEIVGNPAFDTDDAFQNGSGIDYRQTTAIDLAGVPTGTPEALFQSVLWDAPGGQELQFDIPAASGGQFRVELFFAEIWPGAFSEGARQFDVSIDGQLVLDNLDIFAEAGANAGLVKTFDVRSDGNIDIDLFHVVQNPAIAGIQVTTLVDNAAPTITTIDDLTIDEDTSTPGITFSVGDGDGDPVTVTATSSNPALLPDNGIVLANGSDYTLTATPLANQSGSTVISVNASDGFATTTETFTLTVDPVNDLPLADPNSATTLVDTPVTISVLDNDSDIDGSLVPTSVAITTAPASGMAVPNPDGTITFTPGNGIIGPVTFEYTVDDDLGGTSLPAVVDVNVADNFAPTISSIGNQTVTAGGTVSDLAFSVSDPESDLLTVTFSVDNGSIIDNVTITGTGADRLATVDAGTTTGPANVTLTVDDGRNQTETTFQVNVVANVAPTISGIPDQAVNVGGSTPLLPFTVDDAEGDTLTVTPSADNPEVVSSIAIGGTGSDRTVAVQAGNTIGSSNVTLTVDDGSDSADTTFRIDVGSHLNAAGPALPGVIPFIPEDPFRNGVGIDYSRFAPIDLSNVPENIPQSLFQTVLWDAPGDPELQFDIPVEDGGQFQVDLFFAEIWPGAFEPGARQFDVVIDGQLVLDNLDIFAEAGADTGLVKTFEITGDGNLDIDLLHVVQNPAIAGIQVTRRAPGVTALRGISPGNGEEMVNVARPVVVNFAGEIDPSTVSDESIQVMALSQPVAGRLVTSSTNEFVTFYPDSPLPASTEVRVSVNGDMLMDSNGNPVDANGDGEFGGMGTADFSTLPLTLIPNTAVTGRVFQSNAVDGSATPIDVPIEGVTIFLEGRRDISAVTDANGDFTLTSPDGLPAPEFFVVIDGSTATNVPDGFMYPTLGKPFHSVAGQTSPLTAPDGQAFDIFLPLMNEGDIVALDPNAPTTVGFGAGGTQTLANLFPDADPSMFARTTVTFAPGSAQDANGNAATEAVIIPVAPNRIPAPLPEFLNPELVISIQAGGANGFNGAGGASTFDVPAEIAFPNLEGLAPGEQALIFSFDHDAGEFVVVGTGTVSADGLMIESDGGVIRAPGWHFTSDGTEDSTDPDPDPEEEDEEEDEDFEFEITVGLGANVSFQPLTLDFTAGLVLPETLFGDKGAQPFNYSGEFKLPQNPIADSFGTSFSFRVSEFFAKFIPEVGPLNLFGVDFGVSLSAAFGLEGLLDVTGGEAEVELDDLTVRPGNVELVGTFQITDSYLCNIPFDIGEKICSEYTIGPRTLAGLPSIPLPEVSLPLPFTSLIDFNDPFFVGLGASASSSLKISPSVSIQKTRVPVENSTAARPSSVAPRQASAGESPTAEPTVSSANSEPIIADIDSLTDDPSVYFRIETESGFTSFGVVPDGQNISQILPPNTSFTLYTYSPFTNRSAVVTAITGPSGATQQRNLVFSDFGGFDTDGDGIPDVGEYVIGLDLQNADSDGDGIDDGAELRQGLNPLNGVATATGVVASLDLGTSVTAIDVADAGAIVATGNSLVIVDTTQFDSPIVQGQIQFSSSVRDVAVDSERDLAIVTTGLAVQIVDVSVPMMPVLQQTVSAFADQVELFNGFAYVASGTRFTTLDIESGEVVGQFNLPGSGNVTQMARRGDDLFAFVSGSDTLVSIDVQNPEAPVVADQLTVSVASSDVGVFAGNDVLWLAGSGLRSVDISDPANMQILQTPSGNEFFTASRVALNGSGLGLLVPDGGNFVQVYDTSDPNNVASLVTQFNLSGNAQDVKISRGIGYVAAGNRLEVVNYRPFDALGQAPTVSITSPVADVDQDAADLQVFEGTTITVVADVIDDVQARDVELLVDGQVVGRDVSFPFDLSTTAPLLAAGATQLQVQVRATDTGGNSTLSNTILVNVIPDTIAPVIESVSPADGGQIVEGDRTIRVRVNESLDGSSTDGGTFSVVGAGLDGLFDTTDDLNIITSSELRDDNQLIQIAAQGLTPGLFELRIVQDNVIDRAGNPLGQGTLSSAFEVVEVQPIFQGANPDVVFVVDVSGSANDGFGGTPIGDVNSDGRQNTILDGEIASLLVLNQELVSLGFGDVANISVIPFSGSAAPRDMDPVTPGTQLTTTPNADADGNAVRDVEQVLSSLRAGGSTDFDDALNAVISVFDQLGTPDGEGNVIFLSDGDSSSSITSQVQTLRDRNVNLRAFGVGAGANLTRLTQIDPDAVRVTSTDDFLDAILGLSQN